MLILLNLLQALHKLKRCKTHILFLFLTATLLYTFTEYYPYEKDIKQSSTSHYAEVEEYVQHKEVLQYISNEEVKEAEKPKEDKRKLNVTATAYTAFCDTGCTGITRTGIDVRDTVYYKGKRVIAVDPNVVPLYSIVKVDTGEKVFEGIAVDTGGAIDGKRIDILMKTKQRAIEFGRKEVEITVIREGREG